MAHLVETMAYAGETPWHGLGVRVPDDLTTDQFLKKAGLDWEVQKIRLGYDWNDGSGLITHRDSDKYALVRSTDGHELTIISDDWEPVQNQEAFEFFDDFINAGDMEMHTAGSLKNGQIIWVLARVKESFTIFGKDEVDSYLLFTNPHLYGQSIDIRFTPIRVVCNNTLTLSLSQKSDLAMKLNHRKKFDPELVKKTLGIAKDKLDKYKTMAQFLGEKKYTPENVIEYFKTVFPSISEKSDKMDRMSRPAKMAQDILETQPGHEYGPGTWWQPFNAVTYTVDHMLGRSNESRLYSSWYGENRRKKVLALEKALEFAEAA